MQFKRITICIALAMSSLAQAVETLDEVVVTAPAMGEPLVVKTDPRQPVTAHDGQILHP